MNNQTRTESKMLAAHLFEEMLNFYQTPFGMTARPENSIALQTFVKLFMRFINVIGNQAANIIRVGIDDRDVTIKAS